MLRYVISSLLVLSLGQIGAQVNDRSNKLFVAFGLNLLDNNGDLNPFSIIDEFENIAFSKPLEATFSYGLDSKFEIFTTASFNEFDTGQIIDGRLLREDYSYWAIDLGLRYYFYKFNLRSNKVIDFYTHAGGGMYTIIKNQLTFNVGLGATINISNSLEFYVNSSAKFSSENRPFRSNLFQHSFGIKFTLFSFDCSCKLQ